MPKPAVHFRACLAADDPEGVCLAVEAGGERLFEKVVAGGDLGLPATLADVPWYQEPPFELLAGLRDELSTALEAASLEADQPVWVEVTRPAGILPVVPWERLLTDLPPLAGHSIYRLPYHSLTPQVSAGPRRLVVWASSPAAKRPLPLDHLLARLVDQAGELLPTGSEIHVFTDEETAGNLPQRPGMDVHHPRREMPSVAGSEGAGAWLDWMAAALGGRPVDGVHCVGHGYLSTSQGALALAESPLENRDRAWARFLWPAELCGMLNRLGAWWCAFTAPEPNFSVLGLRLLADRLARLRPGPVLFHDLRDDAEAEGMARGYACLAAGGAFESAPSRGLSFYCPQEWVEDEVAVGAPEVPEEREPVASGKAKAKTRAASVDAATVLERMLDDRGGKPRLRTPEDLERLVERTRKKSHDKRLQEKATKVVRNYEIDRGSEPAETGLDAEALAGLATKLEGLLEKAREKRETKGELDRLLAKVRGSAPRGKASKQRRAGHRKAAALGVPAGRAPAARSAAAGRFAARALDLLADYDDIPPLWLTAAQRVVEQSMAGASGSPGDAAGQRTAREQGVADAMKFLEKTLSDVKSQGASGTGATRTST